MASSSRILSRVTKFYNSSAEERIDLADSDVFKNANFSSEDQKRKYLESFRFLNSAFPFFLGREHHDMNTLKMKEGQGKYWGNAIHFLLSNKAHGFPLWKEFEEQMRSEDASFSCKPHVSVETTDTTFKHYFDDPLNHFKNALDILTNDSVLVQLPFQPVMLFQWLTSSYFELLDFEIKISPFYNLPVPKKLKPELACLHELLKTTQRNIGFLFDYLQCQITSNTEIFVGNLKVFDMILKKVMVFHKFWIKEFGIKHIEQLKIKCWQNWKSNEKSFRLEKGNMPLKKRNFLFNPDFWRGPHKGLKLFGNSNEELFRQQDLTKEGSGEQLSANEIEKIFNDLFCTEDFKKVDVAVLKQKDGFLKSLHKVRRAKELMELRQRVNEKDQGVIGNVFSTIAKIEYDDTFFEVARWILYVFKTPPKHFISFNKCLRENSHLESVVSTIGNCERTISLQDRLNLIRNVLDYEISTLNSSDSCTLQYRLEGITLSYIYTHLQIKNFENQKENVLRDWQVVQYLLPCFVASYLNICESDPPVEESFKKWYFKFIDKLIGTYETNGIRKSSWNNIMVDVEATTELRESVYKKNNADLLKFFKEVTKKFNKKFSEDSLTRISKYCPCLMSLYEVRTNSAEEGPPQNDVATQSCVYWNWLMWDFFSKIKKALELSST